MSDTVPHSRRKKAVSSIKRFGVIFFYLWGLLAIGALHKSLILSEVGIFHYRQGLAVVNALVLAKIMFVAEELKVGEHYNRQPLIYAMLFKAAVYSVLLAVFDIMEGLIVGYFRDKSLADSLSDIGGGTPFGILTTILLMFVALVPFFGFRELCDVIGEPELHRLLFVKRARLKVADES